MPFERHAVKILILEDDDQLAEFLREALAARDHEAIVCASIAAADAAIANEAVDAIVLDRMLPDGDGLDFLAALRAREIKLPVVVLSALGEVNHRIEGLRRGGDDYLVKPFDVDELEARLEAQLRRRGPESPETELLVGDLHIDLISREVRRCGVSIRLQPREFELLEYLARHAGQVVTRAMLLRAVWGLNFDPQTNVVDVHVSRLRRKIDEGFGHSLIATARGAGYRLVGGE